MKKWSKGLIIGTILATPIAIGVGGVIYSTRSIDDYALKSIGMYPLNDEEPETIRPYNTQNETNVEIYLLGEDGKKVPGINQIKYTFLYYGGQAQVKNTDQEWVELTWVPEFIEITKETLNADGTIGAVISANINSFKEVKDNYRGDFRFGIEASWGSMDTLCTQLYTFSPSVIPG